jgi:hypothetical protein
VVARPGGVDWTLSLTRCPAFLRASTLYTENNYKARAWAVHERKHHGAKGAVPWQRNSSQVRTSLGLPRVSSPWTGRPGARLLGVTPWCLRQVDLIDTAWEMRCKEMRGAAWPVLAKDYWVDVSQTILRKPWSSKLRAFRPGGHPYSFEADRCLDGTDAMRLLGWPPGRLDATPSGDTLRLAVDSGCLPLTTCIMAAITSNPWGSWHAGTPPQA